MGIDAALTSSGPEVFLVAHDRSSCHCGCDDDELTNLESQINATCDCFQGGSLPHLGC